jgi:hydroxymethylglutaryl-CoA lyase
MKEKITIHEVGPRDGLQMEEKIVSTKTKIEWINQLMQSCVDIIQLGSFVHPTYVPQMADSDALFKHFSASESDILFSGLVLNEKGLERALNCGVQLICLGVSASETHSLKNTKMSRDEALKRMLAVAAEAKSAGRSVQLSVQSAFGCGYEGAIAEEQVLDIIRAYLDAGFKNISLADTAGHGNPQQVKALCKNVLDLDSRIQLTGHFHNTYGMAMANCFAAIEAGVQSLESSFGGLGGCPFTSLAGGNVCTEDLLHMLHRMKIREDILLQPIIEVAKKAEAFFDRELTGMVYKTGGIKQLSVNSKQ